MAEGDCRRRPSSHRGKEVAEMEMNLDKKLRLEAWTDDR